MAGKQGRLNNWQKRKAEIAEEVAEDQERERAYQKRIHAEPEWGEHVFNKAKDPDAQDSRGLDRAVQWRMRAYAETVLKETFDNLPPTVLEPKPRAPLTRAQGMRRDRRDNFLYWEYQLQRAAEDPEALDWEPFNELVATRGVLQLLVYYPRGEELLRDLYHESEYHTMPSREQARKFLENNPPWLYEDTQRGAEEFLAHAYLQVPGIQRAAMRVLASYKRVVRDTWRQEGRPDEPGRLLGDDDPQEPQPVTWDMLARAYGRLEDSVPHDPKQVAIDRAVMMFLDGVPAREAAQINDIGINRFYKILRERNLTGKRGRRGAA